MPTYKTKEKIGDRWRYRFTMRGQRYGGSTPKGANTKKMAEAMEREHIEKVKDRLFTGKMPTVNEFVVRFLEYQAGHTKPLTRKQQEAVLRNHVQPHIGKLALDDVLQRHIDDILTAWANDKAEAKTINTRLGTLRRMFVMAVEWELLAKVPRMKMRKVHQKAPRFLSEDEARRLIDAADVGWRSMVVVALRTGLRVGELRGLQWGDIDMSRGMLTVKRTDPGRPMMEATNPKGGNARYLPLTPDAKAALLEVRPDSPRSTAWVWPAPRWRGARIDRARSEKGCYHALQRASEKSGVDDVGWHTLRHTYASWLVMRGVPMRVVQRYMGHSSIVQTERYSHLAPDFGHESVALLDLPLGQAAPKALPEGDPE